MKLPILLLTIVAPSIMAAGPRNSAQYGIPAEANDAGGGSSSSAAYANVGNIGGFTGVSTVAAQTAKHGFIGQLYEVATLALAANPPSVNEQANTQLGAKATLDDGTWIALTPAQVQWSVDSGPISSISPLGLASAAAVYQNEVATVRGRFKDATGLLGITVINSNPDNYGSYAGDGLDDGWQVQYFGLNNPLAGPGNDPDGDNQNNNFEYHATTDPTDPLSLFRLWIANVDGEPKRKNIIFSPVSEKRNYRVEYTTDVASGAFGPLGSVTVTDNGDERTVTDEEATDDYRFYRVGISFP